MNDHDTPLLALEEAVEKAGGQSRLARKIGAKQQNVWDWLNKSGVVSPRFVLAVERETGVPRHRLRPDLYPPPADAQAA
jgi:DNA-binding transcriptional regulator YdaS (Cro superfamily)